MLIIDHYPETLRDIHDKILDAISGDEVTSTDAAIAVHVTEWIRRNWGARTLTRKWWGMLRGEVDGDQSGTLVEVSADPVGSLRGRELRAAAWVILSGSRAMWIEQGRRGICEVASLIAVTVEAEWTRTTIYIPSGKEVDRAIRDAHVWRAFGGLADIDGVISTFRLSQRQIYDIVKRVQGKRDRQEQPVLPGF
ncbi:hypothetical protein GMLC_14810 [Geomonas limicola]|uniref:Mor transcription activator domain-containing protein n=1 Tax=Geomonas limicola TaxID=2740186 RepID=A0A6V8N5R4_9BACT|nr:Mor transcription activator family protein [Geomonas limicola]GFO67902.1 hypothetical protein GMLC_14810 [Geomonas limicola]